jgi:hypothetical protein
VDQAGDINNPLALSFFNQFAKPVISQQTTIPKYYDNNGVLTPLTGGEAAIHYLFYSSAGYAVQIGTKAYEDFSAAYKALDYDLDHFDFAPGAGLSGQSIPVAQIVISGHASNFVDKSRATIISLINGETGNTISPVDLTLVPQYLLHTMAAEPLIQGDELSMDINGYVQKYPATGGEGQSQYTTDNVILHAAIFLNNSNSQGIIAWVNDSNSNNITFVVAQGNPDGSISYSPTYDYNTGSTVNALRVCRIDGTRAGFIWSNTDGSQLGVVQNNGLSNAPSIGTTRVLGGQAAHNGVDCIWDYDNSKLIGVYSAGGTVYNRYSTINGNSVDSPPYGQIAMTSGAACRCTTEGNNIIIIAIDGTDSKWVEAAWNKPFMSTGRYDDKTNEVTLANGETHCGIKVQNGTIIAQFRSGSSIQTYQTTYSSGSSMNNPSTYGSSTDGISGDLIQTDSGIGYRVILRDDYKIDIWEGTLTGSYELTYTTIFSVDSSNTDIQGLLFGSIFAFGIGYANTDANKVYLVNSSETRTDHFIGVAPHDVLQGQYFDVDIALPLITLPREYPPGTFYNYGPYKYQVLTPKQAAMIIESTIIQTAQI